MVRHRNHGIRKLCDCSRRNWPKCAHAWYFNFKPRGGPAYQFSLDAEFDTHLETKEDAKREADRIRAEIRAGTFVRAAERRKLAIETPTTEVVTLERFADRYVTNKVKPSGKTTWANDEGMLNQLCAFTRPDGSRLGDAPVTSITEDDLDTLHAALRAKGRAVSTLNQYVQVLKAAFRWGAKKGYLAKSPVSGDEDSGLRRGKVAQRARRLVPDVLDKDEKLKEPGEERRLLDATAKNLGMQRLIIAAIETCCRRGEVLALQWADVALKRRELRIKGETAKDAETRLLPISSRLAGILEMARIDPAGKEYKAEDFVFGECGRQVKTTKRAWETAVLKAHGFTPIWRSGTLAPESRAQLRAIDLHFHDLRHEGASRLLERGWPLHHVKDMLGAREHRPDQHVLERRTDGAPGLDAAV